MDVERVAFSPVYISDDKVGISVDIDPKWRLNLKCHYDENRNFPIEAILKHK